MPEKTPQSIITFHDAVTEAVKQRLGGTLPEQGRGGTYRVQNNGYGSDALRWYSQVGVPPQGNSLEWGVKRFPLGKEEVKFPETEDLEEMDDERFLEWLIQAEFDGIRLSSPWLYLNHKGSHCNETQGKGRLGVSSHNFYTITGKTREDFPGLPEIRTRCSLVGIHLDQAVDLYLDAVWKLYEGLRTER